MAQNRFLYSNRIWDAQTILIPSSEVATLPAMFLKDQLRQKPWRTLTGWTIVAGFNDKLDFNRSGVKVATIAAGNYVSATALATEIVAALEAADPAGPTWAVDYSVAAANKFRIFDSAGAPVNFSLLWSTGANAATSIGKDLGFIATADDSGTFTYTADNVAYQSRHYLKTNRIDGGTISVTSVAILEYNAGFTGTEMLRIQGNSTDSWAAPPRDEEITPPTSDNPMVFFFGGDVRAWWRLLIEDVQNPTGYVEMSVLYLGVYASPTINVSQDLANTPEDFSSVEAGIYGTHFRDAHRRRDRWTLAYLQMDAATRALIDTVESENPVGKNFFFVWDLNGPSGHGNGIVGTTYGYLAAPFSQQYVPGNYWTYSAPFHEAL